jgi:hypothetical protein
MSTIRARYTSTSCITCVRGVADRRHLDHREIAGNARHPADVVHTADGNQLVKIRLDQPGASLVGIDDDRHP